MKRYRIVTDAYGGFEVQECSGWWPFWSQSGGINTHGTIELAREYAIKMATRDARKQRALALAGRVIEEVKMPEEVKS